MRKCRVIIDGLAAFLHAYMENKEYTELIRWLKNVESILAFYCYFNLFFAVLDMLGIYLYSPRGALSRKQASFFPSIFSNTP